MKTSFQLFNDVNLCLYRKIEVIPQESDHSPDTTDDEELLQYLNNTTSNKGNDLFFFIKNHISLFLEKQYKLCLTQYHTLQKRYIITHRVPQKTGTPMTTGCLGSVAPHLGHHMPHGLILSKGRWRKEVSAQWTRMQCPLLSK